MNDLCVAGEPVKDLMRGLVQFKTHLRPDGSVSANARLDPELAVPLLRAMMRLEAELLLQDADQVRPGNGNEVRSDSQRRADALVELTRRVGVTLPT